jgi:NADH:ubiquinone oxidoreductase subunit 5 (subunit L)/multisubunit Na+/H+ antiporter MnhA subunit
MSFSTKNPSLTYPPKAHESGFTANSKSQTGRRIELLMILPSIWILMSALPTLRFAPKNWILLQFERIHEHVSRGMQVFIEITGICLITGMAILGILIAVYVWRRRRKKNEDDYAIYRESPLVIWSVYIVIILFFVGVGSLIWLSWQHAAVFENLVGLQRSVKTSQGQGQHLSTQKSNVSETRRPEIHTLSFPKWRVPLILSLLALLGLSIRYILRRRSLEEERETPQVGQIVANAMKELGKDGELFDTLLCCYRDMSKIIGRKLTMTRDLIVQEFTKLLLPTGIHEEGVTRLTDLFEQVPYGRYDTSPNEQLRPLLY